MTRSHFTVAGSCDLADRGSRFLFISVVFLFWIHSSECQEMRKETGESRQSLTLVYILRNKLNFHTGRWHQGPSWGRGLSRNTWNERHSGRNGSPRTGPSRLQRPAWFPWRRRLTWTTRLPGPSWPRRDPRTNRYEGILPFTFHSPETFHAFRRQCGRFPGESDEDAVWLHLFSHVQGMTQLWGFWAPTSLPSAAGTRSLSSRTAVIEALPESSEMAFPFPAHATAFLPLPATYAIHVPSHVCTPHASRSLLPVSKLPHPVLCLPPRL